LDEFWSKDFPIISVTRADLVAAGVPKRAVEQITDEHMQRIASEMGDIYVDHGYWADAKTAFEQVMAESLERELL
jgi:hypothetical protein